MSGGIGFVIEASAGEARRGRLTTPHGEVETPAFMAVATYGAVRGISARDLEALGAQIALANTYHLHERPGEQRIAKLGGLHGFAGFQRPWLTDSGGYQVFSLAEHVKLDESGVAFQSPLDGRRRVLTPESAIEIQQALGPDIAMVLDECPPIDAGTGEPPLAHWRSASERTIRWAARAREAHTRPDQGLFGIVQGGGSTELRRESAARTTQLGFDGYAHGGLGLGESPEQRLELVGAAHAELPREAPRYLMGLGRPEDLVRAVLAGVDLFDCVVPTRHARHGMLFTSRGRLPIRHARFADDPRSPDPDCDCPTCHDHSRAYLRHLFQVGETLGPRLATLHNLRFYYRLMASLRAAVGAGSLAQVASRALAAAGEEAD